MNATTKGASWLDRLQDRLSDSPTWERDALSLGSPWRMGTWFLALNVLILFCLIGAYGLLVWMGESGSLPYLVLKPFGGTAWNTLPQIVAHMGLGRFLCGALFLALTCFLTLFVPLRLFGVFLFPRNGRFFDQIVLSGVTPWRYLAGKLYGLQAFFVLMLLVCLPYLCLFVSLGGLSFLEVLLCLSLLFIYSQVLAVASLAAAVHFTEFLALPLITGGFLISAFVGLIPWSPLPFEITPTGPLMATLHQEMASHGARFSGLYRGGFPGLTLLQSHGLVFAVASSLMLILGALAIRLGPINSLAPGLSTFGEAVLPGDKQRHAWLKRRYHLRRQSELAFLYENHPPSWRRADFRRRWFLRETAFVSILGLTLIWLYWLFTPDYYARFFYPLNTLAFGAALILNGILFIEGWPSERLVARRWEAGHLNRLCMVINLGLAWLGFAWLPKTLGLDLAPLASDIPFSLGHLEIQERHFIVASFLMLPALGFYGMMQSIGLSQRPKGVAAFFAALWMVFIFIIPLGVEALANLGQSPDDPSRLSWVTLGHPWVMRNAVMNGSELSEAEVRNGWLCFFLLHGSLAISALTLAQRRRQRLSRRPLL